MSNFYLLTAQHSVMTKKNKQRVIVESFFLIPNNTESIIYLIKH